MELLYIFTQYYINLLLHTTIKLGIAFIFWACLIVCQNNFEETHKKKELFSLCVPICPRIFDWLIRHSQNLNNSCPKFWTQLNILAQSDADGKVDPMIRLLYILIGYLWCDYLVDT